MKRNLVNKRLNNMQTWRIALIEKTIKPKTSEIVTSMRNQQT
jgi:hypothetical protein